MSDKQTWLVTGAGRGLSADITRAALSAGHAVVATRRNPDRVAGAIGEHDDLLVVAPDDFRAQIEIVRFGSVLLGSSTSPPSPAALPELELALTRGLGAGVVLIAHRLEPAGCLAVAACVEDGVMAHHGATGCAVPVLLARGRPHGVAGPHPYDVAVTGGDEADTVDTAQQLAVGVAMPVGAGAWGEANESDYELRATVAVEHRVEKDVPGEVLWPAS